MNTQKETLDIRKVERGAYEDIEPLLEALDLEYTESKDGFHLACPIHGSDNPSSLSFSPDYKCWKCWSRSCHEDIGGSLFDFIMGLKNCDFTEALKFVCQVYHIDGADNILEVFDSADDELKELVKIFSKKPERSKIQPPYKVKTLGYSPYFESRGFQKKTLKHFGVEDCVDRKSHMNRRAIIPIYNEQDEFIAHIGRKTKEFMEPKYIYSKHFSKSEYLYNYNNVCKEYYPIIYVVEGQGDVWRLWEAGYYNCVGLFGKDMSEYQKGLLLASGATKLVVMTDDDKAGRYAKKNIFRELNRMFRLEFPVMRKKDIGDMTINEVRELLK